MQLSQLNRNKLALAVALSADLIQIIFFPIFAPGALSPVDDILDIAVGAALWSLLGWHYAFIPALIAEAVPGLDMVPTWTAAAFLAIKSKKHVPTEQGVAIDV